MEKESTGLPRACRIVEQAAIAAGLSINIRLMQASTRTAEEAAAACGTRVGQIVKSLVFQARDSGKAVLLLVSGANRVKENWVAGAIGEKISRADADFVRKCTGFSIGGIPPLGHIAPLAIWFDADLLNYKTVFAAAGTPNSIFEVEPHELLKACGGTTLSMHD